MSYIRDFTSVTINQNQTVVQINAGDSNFSVKENSQLFIEGYTVPVTIIESDSNARTLTLDKPWPHVNVDGASARVVPLGDPDTYLSAVDANRAAYEAILENLGDYSGELSWNQLIDPPETSTRWPSFTEVTGDITGLQAIIDLVADYEAKDDAVRSDLNTRIDGLEPTFYSVYTDSTSINALDHLNKMIITTSDAAVRVNLLDAPLDSEFSLVQEGQGIVTFHSPKTILNRQGFYKTAGQFANAYARVIEHDGDTHWCIFGDLAN